jgi:transcription termination factor Rho
MQLKSGNLAPALWRGLKAMTTTTHHDLASLRQLDRDQLRTLARAEGIATPRAFCRHRLEHEVLAVEAAREGSPFASGYLDILESYGFLRGPSFLPGTEDVFVSQALIRRAGLRQGDYVSGPFRAPRGGEKHPGLVGVAAVNGLLPEEAQARPQFEKLTAVFPQEQIRLETTPENLSQRLIDIVAPIGRGQRGLIVSPPKAGKTFLLKDIAQGITANYDDIHLMVVLIGERPEEVTDVRRSVDGEVAASTFDEPIEDHARVAELALERAKRLVEGGKDVVLLLDSITRMTRAYNLSVPPSGRILTGGIDPAALYPPKRFFGAARNTDEGGSLTIIATCLIDTGSRMDDVIYEEFKGTGNMEVHLDRRLAERRIFPAIDIGRSGTRREEMLLSPEVLRQVYLLRRLVGMMSATAAGPTEATERVLERLARTRSNAEFLAGLRLEAA